VAHFLYDNRAMLVATGLLDAALPEGDLVDTWVGAHEHLHRGSAMLDAISRVGSDLTTVAASLLWRLVDGIGELDLAGLVTRNSWGGQRKGAYSGMPMVVATWCIWYSK
jgi:hypothetical protein